ncbi:ABC transporter substrate-binding protein [Pseudotabrizicola sp. 4114]|uniref:taurine ABC transporter substrate-binding protein n=1 Tax=Pseudotabrizicola sp. 4114 TaxID=2817731 RepID=UPI00285B11F8|nr:taurine transport system substrate-binding protein [Pseudorhodobacter sp. 4114]
MIFRKTLTSAAATVALLAGTTSAMALDEVTVAYFMEWPMPFQYAKANGTFDEAMGMKVNWVAFDTGTAMSAAMAAGDVNFAVSQGLPPFVVATSAGQDLQIIDVAVSYSDNDNCVVRSDLDITKDNAADLAGKKVAVPLGTAAHYGFLKQMDHFGVDLASLEIIDMAPPEGAAAIAQGSIDMACGYGGGLNRMKEHGNVLLTGAEKEALGILVFDVTSSPASFVAENPDVVAKFLKVVADSNAMWNEGSKKAEMLPVIAQDAGIDVATAEKDMSTFVFPSVEDQLSAKWLGGGAQEFMQGVAEVFVTAGSIPAALPSYETTVNTAPLTAASGM